MVCSSWVVIECALPLDGFPRLLRLKGASSMKQLCIAGIVSLMGAVSLAAADQTWTGTISDSMCGAKHNTASEHAGKKMSDRDCALACVKDHNAKYVFVSGGKVYTIANQDFGDLQEHAGHRVKLTGEMSGTTITVSKIAMAPKKS